MKHKFKFSTVLLALALLAVPLTLPLYTAGCKSPNAETAAYKTLWSLEASTKAAVDSYFLLVIRGNVSTNDVPKVSKAFDNFQKSMLLAIQLAAGNTNATAPVALQLQSAELVNLVNTAK